MEFWDMVKAFVAANLLLTIVPIVLAVIWLIFAALSFGFKQRRLTKKLGVVRLRDYCYVSKEKYTVAVDTLVEHKHRLGEKLEWAVEGTFTLRKFGSSPEKVGETRPDGWTMCVLDRDCEEKAIFGATHIALDPTWLTKQA